MLLHPQLVCFVTLPAVSTTIFRTLHCDKLAHGEEFLHADLSIDCTSARHRKFKVRKRRRPEALRLPSLRLTPRTPALCGTHTSPRVIGIPRKVYAIIQLFIYPVFQPLFLGYLLWRI